MADQANSNAARGPQEGPLLALVRKHRSTRGTVPPAKGLDWHGSVKLPPPGPRRRTIFAHIAEVLSDIGQLHCDATGTVTVTSNNTVQINIFIDPDRAEAGGAA
jgi:hypothetical protein